MSRRCSSAQRRSRLERRRSRPLYVLVWIVLSSIGVSNQGAPAQASQQPPPSAPSGLPAFRTEIVVTAERGLDDRQRLPVSTAVLVRSEIERLPATTLADVVQALPGFHMVLGGESGLLPAPIARGFFGGGEAEYVKLLVDGIPVSDAESGLADWRRLPAFSIDRVEAVRGPASAVYGDTALGGVVQVFTAAAAERAARLDMSGGSFGVRSVGGALGQPLGKAALDLIGSYLQTDGFRSRSDLREAFGAVAFRQSRNSRRWSARASFNHLDRQEPGALTGQQLAVDRESSDELFQGDREKTRKAQGALSFASASGPLRYSISGHVTGRGGERVRTLLLAPGLGDRARRDISTTRAGASVESSIDTALAGTSGQLRFGADVSRDRVDTTYREVDPDDTVGPQIGTFLGTRWQVAGYATQSMDLGNRWRLHAGVRWDNLRDRLRDETRASHTAWSPRAGAALFLGDSVRATTVFAQASGAFKAATLDQLFDPRPFPDFRGGTFLVSTPSLQPQRAANIEGGVRQSTRRYRWEVVLYRMTVSNEIDFDPATFTYGNIGRSTHTGAELEAAVFRGSRVSAAVNYAWTRVLAGAGSEGSQLKNIPRHLFRPELTVALPAGALLHARYTLTAGAFADDRNAVPLGNRSTLDFRIARRAGRVTARFDLLNVTSDRYEEVGFVLPDFGGGVVPFYYPAPGVAVRAGLELAFHKGK